MVRHNYMMKNKQGAKIMKCVSKNNLVRSHKYLYFMKCDILFENGYLRSWWERNYFRNKYL